jgi:FtsP/CotA-like multicopper oxidase with cupredoxin domain
MNFIMQNTSKGRGFLLMFKKSVFIVLSLLLIWGCSEKPEPAAVRHYTLDITATTETVLGRELTGYLINGSSPGPVLEAEYGENLEITVNNQTDKALILHWHGVMVPNAQDGVADVTGPAIVANSTFTYRFPVKQTGTYWYHAHGLEEAQGIYGAIVLREQGTEPDKAPILMFGGKLGASPEAVLATLLPAGASASAHAGHGMTNAASDTGTPAQPAGHAMEAEHYTDIGFAGHLVNGSADSPVLTTEEDFIKLRLINTYIDGFINLVYAGGDIEIVAADGLNVEPVKVPYLRMAMGETYDVILPVVKGKQAELVSFFLGQEGKYSSVLIGEGEPELLSSHSYSDYGTEQPYARLQTLMPDFLDIKESRPADSQFELTLTGTHELYNWAVENNGEKIEQLNLKAGDKIRFTLENTTMMPHPMHLHGYFFRVVRDNGLLLKHTYNLDPHEKAVIEFTADKEGRWLFHCHNLFHMASGMMITLTVVR